MKKIVNVSAVKFHKAIVAYNEYAKTIEELAIEANVSVDIIDAHVRIFAQGGINIVPVTKVL